MDKIKITAEEKQAIELAVQYHLADILLNPGQNQKQFQLNLLDTKLKKDELSFSHKELKNISRWLNEIIVANENSDTEFTWLDDEGDAKAEMKANAIEGFPVALKILKAAAKSISKKAIIIYNYVVDYVFADVGGKEYPQRVEVPAEDEAGAKDYIMKMTKCNREDNSLEVHFKKVKQKGRAK